MIILKRLGTKHTWFGHMGEQMPNVLCTTVFINSDIQKSLFQETQKIKLQNFVPNRK